MELFSFNKYQKKIYIFSKESFFIFPGMEPCTFQPEIKKLKTTHSRKFLILQETKTSKKILIFQEIELSFVSGKEYLEP